MPLQIEYTQGLLPGNLLQFLCRRLVLIWRSFPPVCDSPMLTPSMHKDCTNPIPDAAHSIKRIYFYGKAKTYSEVITCFNLSKFVTLYKASAPLLLKLAFHRKRLPDC
uniref:Uncharacterized protein n=1 Tax=Utricularia reniformis TaxID=192314 RepID=A0A1Y0AZR2_9LAMI|nr:hypothetical protein AEK19_MT0395 [Utricularia reniformis]ART30665.1 hypothetical protein AEK19_MT0395 [Utricularia reniformis]